jgi:hypothetical protein
MQYECDEYRVAISVLLLQLSPSAQQIASRPMSTALSLNLSS